MDQPSKKGKREAVILWLLFDFSPRQIPLGSVEIMKVVGLCARIKAMCLVEAFRVSYQHPPHDPIGVDLG